MFSRPQCLPSTEDCRGARCHVEAHHAETRRAPPPTGNHLDDVDALPYSDGGVCYSVMEGAEGGIWGTATALRLELAEWKAVYLGAWVTPERLVTRVRLLVA